MIVYVDNPEVSILKKTTRINEFSCKIKINKQKSITFLCTNNKCEKQNQNSIPFTADLKKMKHLEYIWNLCPENYKMLVKELKDLDRWRDLHVHRLEDSKVQWMN